MVLFKPFIPNRNDYEEKVKTMGKHVDTVIQHIHKSLGLDCIMLHSVNLFTFIEGNLLFNSKS